LEKGDEGGFKMDNATLQQETQRGSRSLREKSEDPKTAVYGLQRYMNCTPEKRERSSAFIEIRFMTCGTRMGVSEYILDLRVPGWA